MQIEYLRNFIKLTQFKSFSKVAQELPISQSTLSHQISQLEKGFGGKLIDRSTKKFELTKAGKIFLEYAERIINIYDDCKREISVLFEQTIEDIVISASTIPGSHVLPKYIAEFRNKNPSANFKILINNSQKSIENIKKGLADFAGIGSFMKYSREGFDYIKIGEEKIKFICSPAHELLQDGKNSVNFEDLVKYPFVLREKGSGMRETFKKQFPKYKDLNLKLTINDNDSIISTVSESNYISIMSEILTKKMKHLVKNLEIKEFPEVANRSLFFLKLKDKELSELKNKFWEYLKQKIKF